MTKFLPAGLMLLTALAARCFAGDDAAAMHDGWTFVTVRDETACKSSVRHDAGATGVVISGNGDTICDGKWVKRVPIPVGAQHVRFAARYHAQNIESAARSIIAGITW